jgi:hypothetical protein
MGWVKEEYVDRIRLANGSAREGFDEARFQQEAVAKRQQLTSALRADIQEYVQQGGSAEVHGSRPGEFRVTNNDTRLVLVLRSDISGHAIHYDFEANEGAIAPIGGIFSLRPRYRRVELFSSDQRMDFRNCATHAARTGAVSAREGSVGPFARVLKGSRFLAHAKAWHGSE